MAFLDFGLTASPMIFESLLVRWKTFIFYINSVSDNLPYHRLKVIWHWCFYHEIIFGVGVLDAELGGVEG
jgi:hypothetical protein